jgi:DNA-binding NarL/FixJ family response regulator
MMTTPPTSHHEIPFGTLAEAGAALAARPYVRRGITVSDRQIRVVLADDHLMVRTALKLMLQRTSPEVVVVGEASSGNEAVAVALRLNPDVVIMDLDMPDGDGEEATRILAATPHAPSVLILTMHSEDDRLLDLLRAGARGFLRKDAADHDLVDGIRVVAGGDFYLRPEVARRLAKSDAPKLDEAHALLAQFDTLSDREKAVLRLTAIGYNGPEIGRKLGITAKTVDTYKQRIEEKLGIMHRTDYVRFALHAGLLMPLTEEQAAPRDA